MKVVKAYKNFYSYVAVGNAMMSHQQKNDNFFMKYLKHGYYGSYYFLRK